MASATTAAAVTEVKKTKKVSSNWKKLQSKIAAEKDGEKSKKSKDKSSKDDKKRKRKSKDDDGDSDDDDGSDDDRYSNDISDKDSSKEKKKKRRKRSESVSEDNEDASKSKSKSKSKRSKRDKSEKTDSKATSTEAAVSESEDKVRVLNTVDLWFDDVNAEELRRVYGPKAVIDGKAGPSLDCGSEDISQTRLQKTGKYIGIDCEMVGVGPGGCESVLARVSVVNYYGYTLMDTFVMPQEKVTDYRTFVSGVTPELLKGAPSFQHVQNQVAELMKDRVVVGHSLENDFKALLLDHPSIMIRDTAQYKPFRQYANGRTPGLKKLAKEILNIEIQGGEHSSVEDARVAMLLYRQHRKPWEQTMEGRKRRVRKSTARAKDFEARQAKKAANASTATSQSS